MYKLMWMLVCTLLVSPLVHAEKSVEFLNSGKVMPTGLPFSEAVRVGDVLYLSGQVGVRPGAWTWFPAVSAQRPGRPWNTSRPPWKPTATDCRTW